MCFARFVQVPGFQEFFRARQEIPAALLIRFTPFPKFGGLFAQASEHVPEVRVVAPVGGGILRGSGLPALLQSIDGTLIDLAGAYETARTRQLRRSVGFRGQGFQPSLDRPCQVVEAFGQALNRIPGQLLFLSDVVDELDAAAAAGMATRLVVRPGNRPTDDSRHPTCASFSELT